MGVEEKEQKKMKRKGKGGGKKEGIMGEEKRTKKIKK